MTGDVFLSRGAVSEHAKHYGSPPTHGKFEVAHPSPPETNSETWGVIGGKGVWRTLSLSPFWRRNGSPHISGPQLPGREITKCTLVVTSLAFWACDWSILPPWKHCCASTPGSRENRQTLTAPRLQKGWGPTSILEKIRKSLPVETRACWNSCVLKTSLPIETRAC